MASLQYYYYPFASKNDLTLTGSGDKYRQKQNVQEITLAHLPYLDPRGILLVDGHSNEGSLVISCRNGGSSQHPVFETITAAELAQRLERLPANFIAVKMLVCRGTAFARNVAVRLKATHPGIHVGGYTQSVFHVPGMRAVTYPKGPNTAGSGLVRWFDGNGNVVLKPPRPTWALGNANAPWAPYDPQNPT
jgi:hypothetical protein